MIAGFVALWLSLSPNGRTAGGPPFASAEAVVGSAVQIGSALSVGCVSGFFCSVSAFSSFRTGWTSAVLLRGAGSPCRLWFGRQ